MQAVAFGSKFVTSAVGRCVLIQFSPRMYVIEPVAKINFVLYF
jgi:hypothetical protein